MAQTEKAATAEGDFVKKGGKVDREKKEKEQRLKEQVDQLYGSKAYLMLQKMSMQKNKKDTEIEKEADIENEPQPS